MNPLQRAAAIRKASYLGAILVLFTVSMFVRGAIPVPLGTSAAPGAAPFRWAANHTIQSQARNLEVWELDEREGEAEITGSALRLTLTGSRGLAVTALWLSAIDKQKRNDFHEFETRVKMVTKLQPNFITPWIFQSWNIAYNVSVEMHGSGDMYFYIVRGIQLLAEGERRNKRSPDMRYQIAFYYQNKFGVSDQVEVLRCLYDLSCIPPSKRDPKQFNDLETGRFNQKAFEDFCARHPHLVRRLRGEEQLYIDKRAKEKLRRSSPQEVVEFLRTNWEVPSRYRANYLNQPTDDLAEPENQFPALPPQFNEGPDEADPTVPTPDDKAPKVGYFSAFKAARAWYSHSLVLLPPPYRDAQGLAVPGPTPPPGQFGHDPSKHRVPRLPMMIIFRQGAPRAQTYQADLEQKEGWFDGEGWRIDDPRDEPKKWWFPDDPDRPTRARDLVVGAGRDWSLDEWRRAADMWTRHGNDYGLSFPQGRREALEKRRGDPNTIPAEPTAEQLADPELRERFLAKLGLEYYGSNRSVTNFAYFVAAAQAEAQPRTMLARKTLWKADQARKVGRTEEAVRLYKEGLDLWKQVLIANKDFHRPERSERTEEETFEYELAYQRLLVQVDQRVRERANAEFRAGADMIPFRRLVAPFPEDEFRQWRSLVPFVGPRAQMPDLPPDRVWPAAAREEIKWWVVENVSDADFSSPFVGSLAPDRLAWVNEGLKEQVRVRLNVRAKNQPQAQDATATPAMPAPEPARSAP
ncbi:MAG: hypothetical protein ACKODX_21260 [Gemmata sp.]